MFIAMAIIYPLCRRYYYQFTMVIAPVGALLILGTIIVIVLCSNLPMESKRLI